MANLYPFQQQIINDLTTGAVKPGELKIIASGRRAGKSMMNTEAFKRMWNDINQRPVEDLVFSEGTVYGSRYYCVEPVGGSWLEMESWCLDTYGTTGSIWAETKNLTPEPLQRWYMNNRKFWFKELKDRDWFIMRWRS